MIVSKKRILGELQDMLSDQVVNSTEVDVSANQIYKKFIEPLIKLNEVKVKK